MQLFLHLFSYLDKMSFVYKKDQPIKTRQSRVQQNKTQPLLQQKRLLKIFGFLTALVFKNSSLSVYRITYTTVQSFYKR
jgi:hypothetical protein